MIPTSLRYKVLVPFRGLLTPSRVLQAVRLVASAASLMFILFTLVSPLITTKAYMAQINCAHLDVSYGLYKSLRNSVSLTPAVVDDSDSVFPVDLSLTNSEISILTQYAQEQVSLAPQYTMTSLWTWCYGNYNTTETVDKHGNIRYIRHDDTLVCLEQPRNYVLDYLNELYDIGLGAILAYAFKSTKYADENYSRTLESRTRLYRLMTPALYFGAASQFVIIVFALVLYSNRKQAPDLSKVPVFLLNIMALMTVASFTSVAVAAGLVTRLLVVVRGELQGSLGDFGVSLSLGLLWFTLLWMSFGLTLLVMVAWAFPLWCANPSSPLDEEDFSRHAYRVPARPRSDSQRSASSLYYDKNEEELRRLGESLSRKNTVRHLRARPSQMTELKAVAEEEETHRLLRHDSLASTDSPAHYREETYDGYALSSRHNSTKTTHERGADAPTRSSTNRSITQLARPDQNPFSDRYSASESVLNDDELNFLDQNNFIDTKR